MLPVVKCYRLLEVTDMLGIKNKQELKRVVIVSSETADGEMKQYKINSWVLKGSLLALCVVIGAMIGYLCYEDKFWDALSLRNLELQEEILRLEEEKLAVEEEKLMVEEEKHLVEVHVEELNEQIQILSDTVNEKVKIEEELRAQLEGQSIPTEFPLTGSATMVEGEDSDNPLCVFTASEGTMVVATASGTVAAVNDDEKYGHNVWINHGNGYLTIYRNKGDVTVKEGDAVVRGTTLFLIDEDNTELGYQMQKDSTYINPIDMLAING